MYMEIPGTIRRQQPTKKKKKKRGVGTFPGLPLVKVLNY